VSDVFRKAQFVRDRIEVRRAGDIRPSEPLRRLEINAYQRLARDGIAPREMEAMVVDERLVREFLQHGRMHQQIAVPGSPSRCDHATDFVRSFVIVAEREDVHRLERVAAARDIAKGSLQTEAKRIGIGEQLEAARVLLQLVEDSYQRWVIGGLGGAWCGTRPVTDHDHGRQLNDQRVQRDPNRGWVITTQGDLGVDWREADLSHA